MRDRIGVEIKPGDYVAYAVTAGRSGCLHIGKVIQLVKRPPRWHETEEREKAQVEIMEYYDDTEDNDWYFKVYKKEKPVKKTYIEFPERIVVVNHYVPKPKKARGPEGAEKVL